MYVDLTQTSSGPGPDDETEVRGFFWAPCSNDIPMIFQSDVDVNNDRRGSSPVAYTFTGGNSNGVMPGFAEHIHVLVKNGVYLEVNLDFDLSGTLNISSVFDNTNQGGFHNRLYLYPGSEMYIYGSLFVNDMLIVQGNTDLFVMPGGLLDVGEATPGQFECASNPSITVQGSMRLRSGSTYNCNRPVVVTSTGVVQVDTDVSFTDWQLAGKLVVSGSNTDINTVAATADTCALEILPGSSNTGANANNIDLTACAVSVGDNGGLVSGSGGLDLSSATVSLGQGSTLGGSTGATDLTQAALQVAADTVIDMCGDFTGEGVTVETHVDTLIELCDGGAFNINLTSLTVNGVVEAGSYTIVTGLGSSNLVLSSAELLINDEDACDGTSLAVEGGDLIATVTGACVPDTDNDGPSFPIGPIVATTAGGLIAGGLFYAAVVRNRSGKSADDEVTTPPSKKTEKAPRRKGSNARAATRAAGANAAAAAAAGQGKNAEKTVDNAVNRLVTTFTVPELVSYTDTLLQAGKSDAALALILRVEKKAVGGPAGEYIEVLSMLGKVLESNKSTLEVLKTVKNGHRSTMALDKQTPIAKSVLKGPEYDALESKLKPAYGKALRKPAAGKGAPPGRSGSPSKKRRPSQGRAKKKPANATAIIKQADDNDLWEMETVKQVTKMKVTTTPISDYLSQAGGDFELTSVQAPNI